MLSKVLVRCAALAAAMLMSACKAAPPAGGPNGAPGPAGAAPAPRSDPGWPREVQSPLGRLVLYQPQIDRWDDDKLEARMAVSVTPAGQPEAHFGAVRLKAETAANTAARTVTVAEIEIDKVDFPSPIIKEKDVKKLLESMLPADPMTISLDRVLADLAATGGAEKAAAVAVRNDPPAILIGRAPAAMLAIDGEPYMQPVPGTDLMAVVNTAGDAFLCTGDGMYYLLAGDRWMTTKDLQKGPWTAAKTVPASVTKIPAEHALASCSGYDPAASKDPVPNVYVSTRPAELLVFTGAPEYAPIPSTRLLYVRNTAADVFQCLDDQHHYALLAGRWFRTRNLDAGPWEFVAPDKLPDDFGDIPQDHEQADVRYAVPGTPEAQEAVIAATVPQKAVIARAEAKLTVVYAGEPKFAPVAGTTLAYASNSTFDVLHVGAEYYCCYQAVWFVAPSPTGPWVAAAKVPAVIYTIPPASPLYHVTCVRVYEAGPTTVVVGCTPGYYGCYVGGTTVVYGTGYNYAGAVAAGVWIGAAVTWGACAIYNHYHGGYVCGGWYHSGAHYTASRAGYHASAGWATGPNGGAAWVGGGVQHPGYGHSRDATAGVHNGQAWGSAGYHSHNAYSQWGERVVASGGEWIHGGYYKDDRGTLRAAETSKGGVAGSARTDSGVLRGFKSGDGETAGIRLKNGDNSTRVLKNDDDAYVGRNGNIYKNTGDGWQKHENGSWNQVEKPDRGAAQPTPYRTRTTSGTPQPKTQPAARPQPKPTQLPTDVQHSQFSRQQATQRQATHQKTTVQKPHPSGPPARPRPTRPRGR